MRFLAGLFLSSAVRSVVAVSFGLALMGCEKPDQARPGETWCSAGRSILVIDDSAVPDAVRDAVLASGSVLGTDDPEYSPSPPVVVIPFHLPGQAPNPNVTPAAIRDMFFDTGTGSITDYYLETSYGQFDIQEGGISGYVELPMNAADYGANQLGMDWTRSAEAARDILQGSTIDWASLDEDGDHTIAYPEAEIVFLYPGGGGGANRPSSVQITHAGQMYTISNSFVYLDSKTAEDTTSATNTIRYNIPVAIHEMNHGFFNLPDRYDMDVTGLGPTGLFDMQCEAYSIKHISMLDKIKIGWVMPKILSVVPDRPDSERHCYGFPASESVPAGLVLINPAHPEDMWVVENRFASASARNFDAGLPESGLAIWWYGSEAVPETYRLRLIDVSKGDLPPDEYRDQVAGALWKQRTGHPQDPATVTHLLFPLDGLFSFAVRGVGPSGQTMYAEF